MSMYQPGDIVRHKKTGREYAIVRGPDRCSIEKGMEPAYLYMQIGDPSGMYWVRPQKEMEDGRFEIVSPNPFVPQAVEEVSHHVA